MLDPAFVADCPYGPDALLIDDIVSIDRDAGTIVARMPTRADLPLTRDQRTHPERHPRHVAAALMIHATGMMGFAHAYFVLGLRCADGWIGYGTHIHKVVFRKLVTPGAPIEAVCQATRARLGKTRHLVRYRFEMRHEGAVCYEGEQTAVWLLVDGDAASPTISPADNV